MAIPVIDVPLHLMDLIQYENDDEIITYDSPLLGDNDETNINSGSHFLPEDGFVQEDSFVISSNVQRTVKDIATSIKFLKAGPRKDLHFEA
jgi:hypothetical protein